MPQPRERYGIRPAGTRRHRAATASVALVAAALAVSGCGGSSSLPVANLPSASGSGDRPQAAGPRGARAVFAGVAESPAQRAANEVTGLLFSRCMRAHGVPDFPDPRPVSAGFGFGFAVASGPGGGGIDFAAPLFRAAQRACVSNLVHRRRALR
ncbi:MAG TPA: hypothetical protein VL977_04980 [Solirubrobacteraceae bacterium]|nr:hypothetical protein [Solirubrobacteraceae bacterium]